MTAPQESFRSSSNLKRNENQTLGMEKHLSGVFSYTMHKINNLGVEAERIKTVNQNLSQKLADMLERKEAIVFRNHNLEQEIVRTKAGNTELLKQKEEAQNELSELKNELAQTHGDWDTRKKELHWEIHNLQGAKEDSLEGGNKTKLSFSQQKVKLTKDIQAVLNRMDEIRAETKDCRDKVQHLRQKEKNSMDTIATQALNFKQFLENQY